MKAACRRTIVRIETRAHNDAVMAAAVADDFDEFFMSPWPRETWCAAAGAETELDYYAPVVVPIGGSAR